MVKRETCSENSVFRFMYFGEDEEEKKRDIFSHTYTVFETTIQSNL
jgi:hypothetical protein